MKSNPYVFLFKKMVQYVPQIRTVYQVMWCLLTSKLIWLIEPYVLWKMINYVQLEWLDARSTIVFLILLYGSLNFFGWIFHGVWRVWEEEMKFHVAQRYIQDMFHKVASLPMKRQADNHSGKTIDKINKAMYGLREFSWSNFMYLDTCVQSVWSLISVSLIRWPAWVMLFLISCCTFWIVWKYDQKIVPLIKQKNEKEHLVMSTLFDFFSNIKTIITLRFEASALVTVKETIEQVFPTYARYIRINEWKWFSVDMMISLAIMLVMWTYLWTELSTSWTVLLWTLTMLIQYTRRMDDAFRNFARQYSWLVKKQADMESVDGIEQEFAKRAPSYEVDLLHGWKHIHIDDLSFSYENVISSDAPDANTEHIYKKNVLSWVSIDLVPSRKIALVWESGSGKSTMMSLLRWLYDVDYVKMMIDQKWYDDLHPLAHITSLIPQEPEIFENTIRYNVTMWLDLDDDLVMKYIHMARFWETLAWLPHWLDTDIKEKWVNLSWGQKQRLALARGLVMARESDIMLLDESTSSVDPINERRSINRFLSILLISVLLLLFINFISWNCLTKYMCWMQERWLSSDRLENLLISDEHLQRCGRNMRGEKIDCRIQRKDKRVYLWQKNRNLLSGVFFLLSSY